MSSFQRLINRLHWTGHLMIIKEFTLKRAWSLSGSYLKVVNRYSKEGQ